MAFWSLKSSGFISSARGVLSWQVQHLPPAPCSFSSLSANFPAQISQGTVGAGGGGFCCSSIPVPPGSRHCSSAQDATLSWSKGKLVPWSRQRTWDSACLWETILFWDKPSFSKVNHLLHPTLWEVERLLLCFKANSFPEHSRYKPYTTQEPVV